MSMSGNGCMSFTSYLITPQSFLYRLHFRFSIMSTPFPASCNHGRFPFTLFYWFQFHTLPESWHFLRLSYTHSYSFLNDSVIIKKTMTQVAWKSHHVAWLHQLGTQSNHLHHLQLGFQKSFPKNTHMWSTIEREKCPPFLLKIPVTLLLRLKIKGYEKHWGSTSSSSSASLAPKGS